MDHRRTIGGNVFSVVPLPAMRSFALQPRLAPALAEVVGVLGSLSGDLDVGALGPAVGRFFAKLPADELEAVTRELLAGATMDGAQLFTAAGNPFDLVMRGRTLDVWRLLAFAVEVNYPDFFALVRRGAGGEEKGSRSEASIM